MDKPHPQLLAAWAVAATALAIATLTALLLTVSAWPEPAAAQTAIPDEPDCSTPRRAVLTWLGNLQPERRDPEAAQTCFDWSSAGVAASDRDRLAARLKRTLDARGDVVPVDLLPDQPTTEDGNVVSLFPARYPQLYLVRERDQWLVSRESIEAIPELYRRTFTIDLDGLVERLPEPLREPAVFGIRGWQVLALLLVLGIAAAVRWLVIALVTRWGVQAMQRLRLYSSREAVNHAARPIGTLAFAALVGFWFPLLELGVSVNQVVSVALRVMVGASLVLVLYRVIDVISEVFERRAALTEGKLDDQLVPLVRKTAKVFLVVLGAIFVLQNLDVDVASLLAGVSLGGLAFSLAARDTIAHLFGSLSIFLDRPFQVGDWVVIEGVDGIVEEVGMRSTRIRTFYDSLVTIPNSRAADAFVDNYGARTHRRTYVTLNVTYDTSPEQLEAFTDGIRAILAANPKVRKDKYEIHFAGFGPSSLEIMVYFFITTRVWSEELGERHNVFLEILRLARELGVQFAFPTQTLHVASMAEPRPPIRHEEPATSDLVQTVFAFGPKGRLARPGGPELTHGFYAGKSHGGDDLAGDDAAR
jgi:MscS family membrane protein